MNEKFENGVPVVWVYTSLGDASGSDVEEFFEEEGFTVEFIEEFKDNNGYHNLLFLLKDNVSKFAIYRISHIDMKWWEDYIVNYYNDIPQEIKEKYNVPVMEEDIYEM